MLVPDGYFAILGQPPSGVKMFSRGSVESLRGNSFLLAARFISITMAKKTEINWLSEPEAHNYPAALSYLNLIYDEQTAIGYVDNLKQAVISEFKAKDIFRASNLSLLGISNTQVNKNQQKIQSGDKLSPILLVRDSVNGKVIVADGYHRLCAIYTYDEDAIIPCKIV